MRSVLLRRQIEKGECTKDTRRNNRLRGFKNFFGKLVQTIETKQSHDGIHFDFEKFKDAVYAGLSVSSEAKPLDFSNCDRIGSS